MSTPDSVSSASTSNPNAASAAPQEKKSVTESFQTLKGMRDILPPESNARAHLESVFASIVQRAGYGQIITPLVENLGVFLRVGESTDVVTKEMYDFIDKDGSRIALRPEITAGVVRAFVQHRPVLPWKVWYSGTNFRHERPQRGRYRMFDQLGVEVLGVDDPDLDVEVIALAADFFAAIELPGVQLLMNTLGDHSDRERYTVAVADYFNAHLGDLSKASQETLTRNPLRVLDSKRSEDQALIAGAPYLSEFLSDESQAHYERVLAGLRAVGVDFVEAPRLVRGLDYYRRSTFEFAATQLDAAQNAVGGGGRYDGLAESLGGPPTDGIGFALGVDRILLALEEAGGSTPVSSHVAVYVVDTTGGEHARDISHELRRNNIATDRRFGGGSLKAQMKAANKSGAVFAVIIGEDEATNGMATVRPLRSDDGERAEQFQVSRSALVDTLIAESVLPTNSN